MTIILLIAILSETNCTARFGIVTALYFSLTNNTAAHCEVVHDATKESCPVTSSVLIEQQEIIDVSHRLQFCLTYLLVWVTVLYLEKYWRKYHLAQLQYHLAHKRKARRYK